MERIMTLDEADIIHLIAKSVGVKDSRVKLKMSVESLLTDIDVEGEGQPVEVVDTLFKMYAKIELPVTEIDGTPVNDDDNDDDLFYADENDNDCDNDNDGSDC